MLSNSSKWSGGVTDVLSTRSRQDEAVMSFMWLPETLWVFIRGTQARSWWTQTDKEGEDVLERLLDNRGKKRISENYMADWVLRHSEQVQGENLQMDVCADGTCLLYWPKNIFFLLFSPLKTSNNSKKKKVIQNKTWSSLWKWFSRSLFFRKQREKMLVLRHF